MLVPLIQDDLKQARDAAERAGMPYFQAAGDKLLEAKAQLAHGEFGPWVKLHFNVSLRHAQRYMQLADHVRDQKRPAGHFSSLKDFIEQTSNPNGAPPAWREPVKQIVERVDTDILNRKREELKRTGGTRRAQPETRRGT